MQRIKRGTNCYYTEIPGKDETDIYLGAASKAAEKFGYDSLAYRSITNGINTKKGTGSQYFWVTHLNACLPPNRKVISFEEMEMINDHGKTFFEGFYTYVPEIVLRTRIPFNQKEQFILEDLVRQVQGEGYEFSSEKPLRITGLELVKDENPANTYGLLLKAGGDTRISTDKRLAFSNSGKNIRFGKNQKNIWTRRDSLSAICLGGGASLYTDGGFELYADCVCRAVVIGTEGVRP